MSHRSLKSDLKVAQKWSKSRLQWPKSDKVSHRAPKSDIKVAQELSKSRLEIKIGQKFDPSKPSRLKDTGVLSWGIFSKNVLFFSNEKMVQNWTKV